MADSEVSAGPPSAVELGFVEKAPSWLLKSKFFRSKIGGRPAWLSLENIPETGNLICKNCDKPFTFLLQVYAPLEDREDAFHRTIFLFMCADGKCCRRFTAENFVAFRSQLPRRNQFYDFEPPKEVEEGSDTPSAADFQTVCHVCGCRGSVKCKNCEKRTYCSNMHREIDLRSGHSDECRPENDETGEEKVKKRKKKKQKYSCLLPEYELVTDTEVLPAPEKEKSDEEKMREYHEFLKSAKAKSCVQDGQLDDVENLIKKPDKLFSKFQKRVALEPDQVLRYQRGGVPLWVSSDHIPSGADIPKCECGAERIFEFQVMPQLLNHLSLDVVGDSIDWGTLIVYTCSKSCSLATASYAKEFVWKQDFSGEADT